MLKVTNKKYPNIDLFILLHNHLTELLEDIFFILSTVNDSNSEMLRIEYINVHYIYTYLYTLFLFNFYAFISLFFYHSTIR